MHNNFQIKAKIYDIVHSGNSFCIVCHKKRKFKVRTIQTNVILWSKDKKLLDGLKIGECYIFEFYLHGFENIKEGKVFWGLRAYLVNVVHLF